MISFTNPKGRNRRKKCYTAYQIVPARWRSSEIEFDEEGEAGGESAMDNCLILLELPRKSGLRNRKSKRRSP